MASFVHWIKHDSQLLGCDYYYFLSWQNQSITSTFMVWTWQIRKSIGSILSGWITKLLLLFLIIAMVRLGQFSSTAQSCSTLCDPMDCGTPGFPVHHQLLELDQIRVYWVGDAIQPSHSLPPLCPFAFNLSQHQGLFYWISSSHQVAKLLKFQLQRSFQWIFRTDFF